MSTGKTKGKGMPPAATLDFEVKPPFQIMEDNRRRFIRIDFEEPVRFFVIKAADGAFWPDSDGSVGDGEILNISAGGILMFTSEPILESTLLLLTVNIEGVDAIDNILGKVKRTEIDSGGYLVGVETITREQLFDILTPDEIEKLPPSVSSFTERLRSILNRYIYSRKLENDDE